MGNSPDDHPDLFDWSRARTSDPATSHEAAESIDISAQALTVLRAYRYNAPLLDHDAYRLAGFAPGRVTHQRCSDLRRAGLIARTGGRARTPSGRSGYLCQITPDGVNYLRAHRG